MHHGSLLNDYQTFKNPNLSIPDHLWQFCETEWTVFLRFHVFTYIVKEASGPIVRNQNTLMHKERSIYQYEVLRRFSLIISSVFLDYISFTLPGITLHTLRHVFIV